MVPVSSILMNVQRNCHWEVWTNFRLPLLRLDHQQRRRNPAQRRMCHHSWTTPVPMQLLQHGTQSTQEFLSGSLYIPLYSPSTRLSASSCILWVGAFIPRQQSVRVISWCMMCGRRVFVIISIQKLHGESIRSSEPCRPGSQG